MDFQRGFNFKNQCSPLRASKEVWVCDFEYEIKNMCLSLGVPIGVSKLKKQDPASEYCKEVQKSKRNLYLWISKEVSSSEIDVDP